MFTEKYNNAIPRGLAASVVTKLILFALLMAPVRIQAQTGKQLPVSRGSMVASATAAAEQSQVKYKGIWEPVSYQEDLKLLDVFFATADEGWVAGGRGENSGGVILHTSDGGTHWENQYGDPASSDGGVRGIRFLDPTHGWAVQWTGHAASLLHTRDGKNWILSGTIPEHAKDYMFSSETNGVVIDGGRLLQTTDGGRRWIPVNQCEVSVQVDGLARRVNCTWVRVQFLTPTVGYAAGFSVVGVSGAPVLRIVVLGKSTDGGATWALTTGEVTGDTQDAFFIDENTGYVRAGDQLFKTTDGGQTWTGMAASPGDRLQFADPEVGWSHHYNQVSFTTDGGNRWNSREYPFPAHVETFSLPRRDRGYIVGDHGMIYRYRIVPQDYAAKGMLPAPLLSGIDSPLDVYVQQLVAQVNKISADVGLPPVNTAAPGTVPTQSAVAGGGFTQNTDPNGAATAPDAAAGGFTQNTDPNGSAATAGAGGFSQDVRQAQTTLYSVSTETPKFTSKYRNLNLLLAGLQMASQMTAQVQALQQSLQSLKYAKDPRSAAPSITKVQTSVASLLQLVQNAYQKPR